MPQAERIDFNGLLKTLYRFGVRRGRQFTVKELAERVLEHADISDPLVPAAEHMPGCIISWVEFDLLVHSPLDARRGIHPFPLALERQHLPISDGWGKLRLGVFLCECCCAQSIVQCYFAKPEFLRECVGVSHQMAVVPRVAHNTRRVTFCGSSFSAGK